MKIRSLLEKKGYELVTVPPSLSLLDAIRLLVAHNIGSVIVEDDNRVRGILTERDVLRQAAKSPEALSRIGVEEIMTREVVVGVPDDTLDYVMEIMTRNRIRHLPVVEDGWLVGIVSIGDVVDALRKDVEAENRYLRDYIQGKFD